MTFAAEDRLAMSSQIKTRRVLVGDSKTTAPRIPIWSPTMVLTGRYMIWLPRADGMGHFSCSMAVDAHKAIGGTLNAGTSRLGLQQEHKSQVGMSGLNSRPVFTGTHLQIDSMT